VPLVGGAFLAESVEAVAAARAFHYSTFGADWTWKLGGRWSPVRDVTLRGTLSTAFRAPSIADLYLGAQDNFAVGDPCADPATAPASCPSAAVGNGDTRPQVRSTLGGDADVRPETASIWTAGVVLEPRWVRNLSVAVDYYAIEIDDAISTIGEGTIVNGCYPAAGAADPALCARVERDPVTQRITNIDNRTANLGKEWVSGADLSLRWRLPPVRYGRLALSFDGSWLERHDLQLPNGTILRGRGTFDLAGTNGNLAGFGGVNPEWKWSAGVAWALRGFQAGVQTRYIGSFEECGDADGFFYPGAGLCSLDSASRRKVDAYNAWDLSLGYTLATGAGKTAIALGVNNVFDAKPAVVYNGFSSASDPTAYDFLGRFVYTRISHAL
jgi:outer membrane receptor protein involved in Fe transport